MEQDVKPPKSRKSDKNKSLIREHKRLIHVLRSKSELDDKAEAILQANELSEYMAKGAAARMYGTPPKSTKEDKWKASAWVEDGITDFRSTVPPLQDPGLRLRALNKLSRLTSTRRNPDTGEREFLLHRGMSDGEFNRNVKNNFFHSDQHSSWTPAYNIAKQFSKNYIGGVVSAWINERHIHSVPYAQDLASPEFAHEKEVIVRSYGHHPIAEYHEPDSKEADIGQRLQAFKKRNMYKSETLEDRLLGKLRKSYDDSSLNKNKNHSFDRHLSSADSYPGWEEHNSFVHDGINAATNHFQDNPHIVTSNIHLSPGPNHSVVLKQPLDWQQLRLDQNEDALAGVHDSHFTHPGFKTSHREAMYNKLATDVFGMGQYVPPTSLIKHPGTGDPWSAQIFVQNSRAPAPKERDFSKNVNNPSDIYKLGIMDTILGNNDRHLANMRIDNFNKLHLIDNAMSFDYSHRVASAETPATIARNLRDNLPDDVHAWIHQLDGDKMTNMMREKGVPEAIVDMAGRRLREAKRWSSLISGNPHFSKDLGGLLEMVQSHRLNWDNLLSKGVRDNALTRIKRGEVYGSQVAGPNDLTVFLGLDNARR
jgi:hypothetical protein